MGPYLAVAPLVVRPDVEGALHQQLAQLTQVPLLEDTDPAVRDSEMAQGQTKAMG